MSDQWNPNALPFRPGGYDNSRHDHYVSGFENQLPPPFPPPRPFSTGPPNAPWNANYAPMPLSQPPMPYNYNNNNNNNNHHHQSYHQHGAHAQAQAYYPWMQHGGYNSYGGPPHQPYGMPPYGQQPYGQQPHYGTPPGFGQQHRQTYPNRAYQHPDMQSQVNIPYRMRNEDIRAPTPLGKKSKSGPATNGHTKHKDMPKASEPPWNKSGRYGDEKIMLPAPQPTQEYLDQAAQEPSTATSVNPMLVILDLNGTVLFRPNRNAKTMIERPFLKPFLRFLFQNFKVMVWSSAKPDNVKALVNQALDNDLRSKLVVTWARDSFGLSPANYQQNVQVYKNLKLVWSRNQIHSYHPDYETGGRFGQHNTILIDDSSIKASAQPHNLLEIPEFSATPEQMKGDVLREVAGYLETLRQQADVSKFINKEPFKDGGQWRYDWPNEIAGGGEMMTKVSAANESAKKKNKKKPGNTALDRSRSNTPFADTANSLASVSLAGSVQKDW